jgi:cell fate (sporulation/competence/biofilm development) regulator YmcA (YheA/YmcA/DUF963 family)
MASDANQVEPYYTHRYNQKGIDRMRPATFNIFDMTKQEFITEKKNKITALNDGQEKICKDIEELAKRPFVDFQTSVNNATQIVQWVVIVRSMEAQKHLIVAQPFPKPSPGGEAKACLAIVGENKAEEIIHE